MVFEELKQAMEAAMEAAMDIAVEAESETATEIENIAVEALGNPSSFASSFGTVVQEAPVGHRMRD